LFGRDIAEWFVGRSVGDLSVTVLPNINIETGWSDQVSANSVVLVARVINTGVIPTGSFDIWCRIHAEDGFTIGISSVDSIAANGAREIAFKWIKVESSRCCRYDHT
jgi:hypothetical protein